METLSPSLMTATVRAMSLISQLETGDNLVAGRGVAARYCHFVDDVETARLFNGLPLDQIGTFTADGRRAALNRYLLLRRVLEKEHNS